MRRNPEDPYIDESDGVRIAASGTPWTIIGLFVGLVVALTLWIFGIV